LAFCSTPLPLMAALDAVKKVRIARLTLRRNWENTYRGRIIPRRGRSHGREQQGEGVDPAALLRDELTFTSFRHGGFTEAVDAEWTERELMAPGR
jgi:hypothetical protein